MVLQFQASLASFVQSLADAAKCGKCEVNALAIRCTCRYTSVVFPILVIGITMH